MNEQRLKALDIELPPVPAPLGAYVLAVQSGNLLFLTGMLPMVGGRPEWVGSVGEQLTAQEGRDAARAAALNALAVMRQQLGSLDRIVRIVRLGVFIATAGQAIAQPWVADGASELFRDVLGPEKLSARMVIGAASLPLGMPIELEVIVEVAV